MGKLTAKGLFTLKHLDKQDGQDYDNFALS